MKQSSEKNIKKVTFIDVLVGAVVGVILNIIVVLVINIVGIGGGYFQFSGMMVDISLGSLISILGSIVLGSVMLGGVKVVSTLEK